MIEAESYRFIQGIVIFVGGMLSTTFGVAWGMQKWKSKIEGDIITVNGKVTKLETDFAGVRPFCALQRQEILATVEKDIGNIVKLALKDARITDVEEHGQIAATLARLDQKQDSIIERLDTRERRDNADSGYYDRSKRARASDNINPVTGKVL